MRLCAHALLGSLSLALGACFLPLSTGAPQSASTVGKNQVGLTAYAEAPTVDLQATTDEPSSDDYDFSPLPTVTMEGAYGLTDNLDIELALDGVLYVIVPLPLGGSIGLRQQIVDTPKLAVALSARLGYVQLGVESNVDALRNNYSAIYGKATAAAQYNPRGRVRPGAALTLAPARIEIDGSEQAAMEFDARSATLSTTLSIAFGDVELGPFVNVVYFDSGRLHGSTVFYSGGFMVALRPQKSR